MFRPDTGEFVESFTHKGYSNKSTWARAHAWAMLGYAFAMKWVPEDAQFASVASRVADWWIAHVPKDYVAFWDFDDPQIPETYRDTSATTAAAAALLKLSALVTDERRRKRYRDHAEETVRSLPLTCDRTMYNAKRPPGLRRPTVWAQRSGHRILTQVMATGDPVGDARAPRPAAAAGRR